MMPSLKALQAVEAAARTGSFAAAAAELSVTPAAISQLVRTLEAQLNCKMFSRVNRRVVPTEAALEVLPKLHPLFEELKVLSGKLAGHTLPARLTISAPASVASGWLSQRISTFVEQSDTLSLSIKSDEDPVAFERDRIDVRMSFGHFHYRNQGTSKVCVDSIYPVCSPELIASSNPLSTPEQLVDLPFIHTDWGSASVMLPQWRDWFASLGLEPPPSVNYRGFVADSSRIALELATSGLGVTLAQGLLVSNLIQDGKLVIAYPHSIELEHPYCLTVSEHSKGRASVVKFEQWFRQECQACVDYPRGILSNAS